jgi:hypothetical protein
MEVEHFSRKDVQMPLIFCPLKVGVMDFSSLGGRDERIKYFDTDRP